MKYKTFWLMLVGVAIFSTSLLGQNFTWTLTSAPPLGWGAIASSSNGTELVARSATEVPALYTSTNSGTTWSEASVPISSYGDWDAECMALSSDGTKLVVANWFHIYVSTNLGMTWVETSAPSQNWFSIASSSDGTKLVAGVLGGGIYVSTNSGVTWTQSSAPANSWSSIASSSDGTKLAW